MARITVIASIAALLTIGTIGHLRAEGPAAQAPRVLEVDKLTPRLEVRESLIGFRDTLVFYTFKPQKAVLKLQIGNKDKTFPVTATLYTFEDGVTQEGLDKWLNNQHSDALFPDVPEPTATHKAPDTIGKVTAHKLIDHTRESFGEFDNYTVTFKISDYAGLKGVQLLGFTAEARVHIKTK